MKTLLLNLPHRTKVIRRYMCSYNAPNIMFPPLELLALGGIAKRWKNGEVKLIDAIAEDLSLEDVEHCIGAFAPDVIVSISGFECFEEDMGVISQIKKNSPTTPFILFGHYATQFWREIMEKVPVDFILLGEPDLKFAKVYEHLENGKTLDETDGVVYRKEGTVITNGNDHRIPDPNELPIPAYELLKGGLYFEPFMERPFGMIQTARGCPYQCNYCVKSFGTKLTTLRPERIIEELLFMKQHLGIRSIRFIDDTFTAIPKNVLRLCELMVANNLNLTWSCLTRPDTINRELLTAMKAAGCKRIFFGVESGSQRVLDLYNKGLDVKSTLPNLQACQQLGIETLGWFMVGQPGETREDLDCSIAYAKQAGFNYVLVSKFIPYPGTPIFSEIRDQINFSILPYKNEFKDKTKEQEYHGWEKEFFLRYYFRPAYVFNNFKRFFASPTEFVGNVKNLSMYLLLPNRSNKRKDFA